MILPRYNYKFILDESVEIPINEELVNKNRLNKKNFVKVFVAVTMSQLFDAPKVIYKYYEDDFYLDIYIEQRKTGIFFIDDDQSFTDQELEIVQNICDVFKIKLILVKLYGNRQVTLKDNVVELDISQDEPIENIDGKTMDILMRIGESLHIPSFGHILSLVDTYTCYKIAILLSLEKKLDKEFGQWR